MTAHIQVSDEQFLRQFDLERPAMREAKSLLDAGQVHAAALATARLAGEGPVRGAILAADLPGIRQRVLRLFPRAVDLEIETTKLLMMEHIPSPQELGYVQDHRIGVRARVGRTRGNDALICALIYSVTGDAAWARTAIDMGLRGARSILPADDVETPPAYPWHPRSDKCDGQNNAHRLQYWMQAWPMLHDAMTDEQRLEWMKIIIHTARSLLKANRHEVPHNLTFHGLAPALQVAGAFQCLRESEEWRAIMEDRLIRDFSALPFITPDGYSREGTMYHNVNTRILSLCHMTYLRCFAKPLEALQAAVQKAFNIQWTFVTPDSSNWLIGDGAIASQHERWQIGNQSLHLGAALFNRPEFKALAGSMTDVEPELLNCYLMGSEGIDRWAAMPAIDVRRRVYRSSSAPQSGFHVLRAGRGSNAHAGLLWFGTEHNHGHHDKGQALIYGLGRHLLSDSGFAGYGLNDADPLRVVTSHGTAATIRRVPLGPRMDWNDQTRLLNHFESDRIQIAAGEHSLYENHIVRRAMALVTPWPEEEAADGSMEALWIVWDQIVWKRGWPGSANEPMELVDTRFPFNAPADPALSGAMMSSDGRSAWSLHAGLEGPPFAADAPPRAVMNQVFERCDCDANIQVIRLGNDEKELWDLQLAPGVTSHPGDKPWPRPVATYRWRGYLPHVAAYVLVPYKGVRQTPYAAAEGRVAQDGVECRVTLGVEECRRTVSVKLRGLPDGKLSADIT